MYFALPAEWVAVPTAQLEKAQTGWIDDAGEVVRSTITWQAAWSTSPVGAGAVFGGAPSDVPIVYALRRDLIDVETSSLDGDLATALQDLVIPGAQLLAEGADLTQTKRAVNGFDGLEQLATYDFGGGRQTVHVNSMLSPDRSALYQLVIRCTESCYAGQTDTITDVLDSLTFEEVAGNG